MRILNIDDSTVNNMLMEHILNSLGHETISVIEGSEAIEKIREYQPDVIILDLMMPGKSGLDVLEDLRAEGIQTPVIVITAMNSHDLRNQAFALGAADYQPKPVNANSLQKRLEQVFQD